MIISTGLMTRLGNHRNHLTRDGGQDLRSPGIYTSAPTQEMVHTPAHLQRKELEGLAEERMLVEENQNAQPSHSQHCPANSVLHRCVGVTHAEEQSLAVAYLGTGRRGRNVFPVWSSREVWDPKSLH